MHSQRRQSRGFNERLAAFKGRFNGFNLHFNSLKVQVHHLKIEDVRGGKCAGVTFGSGTCTRNQVLV